MIRSHLVKPGISPSKPVPAGLVWFEPVKTGSSHSKPVCADQNRIEPVWTCLSCSNQVTTALSR
ncbi:hypothetical protein CPC197_1978 [Chlamydia psittaci C1/97]|nr:hypothetical protein CPC197_1978 [Chlamydia psittaci C1/97]